MAVIHCDYEPPTKRQAQLLGISRGTVFCHPEPGSDAELVLMRPIDEPQLEHPFAGGRILRDMPPRVRIVVAPIEPRTRGRR